MCIRDPHSRPAGAPALVRHGWRHNRTRRPVGLAAHPAAPTCRTWHSLDDPLLDSPGASSHPCGSAVR
eukprot:55087-Eustigmatos_ZCMA.PRE.1